MLPAFRCRTHSWSFPNPSASTVSSTAGQRSSVVCRLRRRRRGKYQPKDSPAPLIRDEDVGQMVGNRLITQEMRDYWRHVDALTEMAAKAERGPRMFEGRGGGRRPSKSKGYMMRNGPVLRAAAETLSSEKALEAAMEKMLVKEGIIEDEGQGMKFRAESLAQRDLWEKALEATEEMAGPAIREVVGPNAVRAIANDQSIEGSEEAIAISENCRNPLVFRELLVLAARKTANSSSVKAGYTALRGLGMDCEPRDYRLVAGICTAAALEHPPNTSEAAAFAEEAEIIFEIFEIHGHEVDREVAKGVILCLLHGGCNERAIEVARKFDRGGGPCALLLAPIIEVSGADEAISLFRELKKMDVGNHGEGESDVIILPERALAFQAVVRACARNGRLAEAVSFLKESREEGIAPTYKSYLQCLRACARSQDIASGLWRDALQILDIMRDSGNIPSVPAYEYALISCSNCGRWEEAYDLLSKAYTKDGVVATVTMQRMVMEACGRVNEAEAAFIDGTKKSKRMECCLAAFQMYNSKEETPEVSDFNLLFKTAAMCDKVEVIVAGIHGTMMRDSIKLDFDTYQTAMKAYADAGRWQEAVALLQMMVYEYEYGEGPEPSSDISISCLLACGKSDSKQARLAGMSVVSTLQKAGVIVPREVIESL